MKQIFSIWHSIRTWEEFTEILDNFKIDYICDVRSIPYSKYNPQYNKNRLQEQLNDKYIFMWNNLGWIDEDISYERFIYWIEMLVELAEKSKVVFMCSEKDYLKCHRYKKITPELEKRWFNVIHL